MNTNKTVARVFGIFFLIAFLSYGLGSGLIDSIVSVPDFLSNVYANKATIIAGVLLMALVHSFVNIGMPVVILPILTPINKNLTFGYLSAAIAATVVLIIGAISLLLLIPLSDEFIKTGSTASNSFETLGIILKNGGNFAYQLGMAIWGIGGLMLVTLLYKSKLVPRPLSYWGFIGYIIFIAGTILELYGYKVGVQLAMPGGLFEISLSLWLIVKGFNSSAISSEMAK